MSEVDPNLPNETDPVPPVTPPVEPSPQTPQIDYENKFKESTRENQLLREQLKANEAAGKELTKEPTDSELKAAFPAWDAYTDAERDLARRTFGAERNSLNAARIAQDLQADRARDTAIEIAVSSTDALQGKEQAFRQFCSRPQYKNVPMELLVDAFLGKQPAPAPKPTPKPGLLPSNGGPKETPKPKTLSAEDLSKLRNNNPKAYQDYLKTHPIEDMSFE